MFVCYVVNLFCRIHKSTSVEFANYLNYARSLRFDDKPDYAFLRRMFRELFYRCEFETDFLYDWTVRKAQVRLHVCFAPFFFSLFHFFSFYSFIISSQLERVDAASSSALATVGSGDLVGVAGLGGVGRGRSSDGGAGDEKTGDQGLEQLNDEIRSPAGASSPAVAAIAAVQPQETNGGVHLCNIYKDFIVY